jgi:hypothetical protein
MGGHKGPDVEGEGPGLHQGGEAGHEVFSVRVLPDDGPALDPPHHHVVEDAGRIQSRTARHRQAAPLPGRCEHCVGLGVVGIIHQSNLSSNVPFSEHRRSKGTLPGTGMGQRGCQGWQSAARGHDPAGYRALYQARLSVPPATADGRGRGPLRPRLSVPVIPANRRANLATRGEALHGPRRVLRNAAPVK